MNGQIEFYLQIKILYLNLRVKLPVNLFGLPYYITQLLGTDGSKDQAITLRKIN